MTRQMANAPVFVSLIKLEVLIDIVAHSILFILIISPYLLFFLTMVIIILLLADCSEITFSTLILIAWSRISCPTFFKFTLL